MKPLSIAALILLSLASLAIYAQPAAPAALEPIRYERVGGLSGTHDVIEITKEGNVTVDGKLLGQGKGKLTPDKAAALALLFGDWNALAPSFAAPPGAADGFEVKIRYGAHEVSANDANGAIPPNFRNAREALEQIAHEVAGK